DVRRHIAGQEVHRVDDAQASGDAAAGAVDVEVDVALGVIVGQIQQLRDDEVGYFIVNRPAQKDDAVVEQAGVDVIGPLAAAGLFDDDGNECRHGSECRKLNK